MTDANGYHEAMADVRRAYRLVWAYQRRVLDAINAVGAEFAETQHYSWQPHGYGRPPRSGTDPTDRWAWDGLPFLRFSVMRNPIEMEKAWRPSPGNWLLEIVADIDSAWSAEERGGEPDVSNFERPETSMTSLSLHLWLSTDDHGDRNWEQVWWTLKDYPEIRGHLDDDKVECAGNPGMRMAGIRTDFASIKTADDARDLAHRAREFAREKLDLPL